MEIFSKTVFSVLRSKAEIKTDRLRNLKINFGGAYFSSCDAEKG